MAISVPRRRRWPQIVAALVAGLVAGVLIGLAARGGEESANPNAALDELRSELIGAANTLEVAVIEYREAARGAQGIEGSAAKSRSVVARSKEQYKQARPSLERVAATQVHALDSAYARIEEALASDAPAAHFAALSERTERMLRGAISE